MAKLSSDLEQHFNNLEGQYGLPQGLLKSVAYTESRFNPDARSPVGASGLFQFMPATAKQYGVDVSDPVSSANGAAKMYADLLKSTGGDLPKALAAYNWGIGNLNKNGLANAPKETQNYIRQITNLMGSNNMSSTTPEKKNSVSNADLNKAFDEYMVLKNGGSQASLSNQVAKPNDADLNKAFDEYMAQQQSAQASTPVQTPVDVNNAQASLSNQTNPASTQSVINSQAQNVNLQPKSPEELGQMAYQKLLQIKDPNKLNDFINSQPNSTRLFLQKTIATESAKNPELHLSWMDQLKQGAYNGAAKINNAIEQIGTLGQSKTVNDRAAQQEKAMQLNDFLDPSAVRTAGDVGVQLLGAAALPETTVFKGAGAAAKVGNYALSGAAAAVLSNPVEGGDNFIEQKLGQAATGAAIGGGLGIAANKVGQKLVSGKLTPEDELNKIKEGLGTFDKNGYLSSKGLDKVAADDAHPYNFAAKELQSKMENLDVNDPNAVLKAASEANYLSKKIQSKNLYDEADKLAPNGVNVELKNASKVLDDAKAYEANISTPALKSQISPVINNIESALKNGPIDYKKSNNLLQEFGVLARQATKTGDDNAARIYNDFRTAINADKDASISSLPNSAEINAYKDAYNSAKNFNKDNIQNVKNNVQLRNLMEPFSKNGNPNLPDNLISNLVKKGQTDKVQTLFNNLDSEGQNAVQQGVLNKLMETAKNSDGNIDPTKFTKAYKSYSDTATGNTPLNVVFEQPVANRIKDLMDIFATASKVQSLGLTNVVFDALTPKVISQGIGLLKHLPVVKALVKPEAKKLVLSVKNTNPKTQAYVDKVSKLISMLSAEQQ